jgi:hypothetical protein
MLRRFNPKELPMLYKTMVLELLQQHPEMHDQLRKQRTLLATMERLAMELKDSHETWKASLAQARPESSESQIASEALELALQDFCSVLLPPEHDEPGPLENAMTFLRRHTPPA